MAFGDVRGFAAMSAAMDPATLIDTLNRSFGAINAIVEQHEGRVMRFEGDNLMLVWSAPVEVADHAQKAVRCALAIQVWSIAERRSGGPDIAFGFGVNTGPVKAGYLGDPESMQYRVIGDTANLASRLTSADIARRDQVVVSGETLALLGDDVAALDLGSIFMGARAEPIRCYQIDRIGTIANPNPAPPLPVSIGEVRLFNEMKRSRELEAASRNKSEFLANMSHEVRTPLNAIIGFAQVLRDEMFGPLNGKQREYLDDVLSSGRHLLTLINDMLDLAKVEAGHMELERSEFDLAQLTEVALTLVRERAMRGGIELVADVPLDARRVVADERKLKQVLLNLLTNAVKFTPRGGSVTVTARRDAEKLKVAVRDTGVGIPPGDLNRIFEEFQQSRGYAERSVEGTGLGLTLSKRFVELHGGQLWAESEVGKGSIFTLTIPQPAA